MSESAGGNIGGAPRLGAMFGRYRIDSVIGRGGMGVVLRATDTDLDRPVALKLLAPELPTDQATRDRFMRESRLAAAIEHPHIVPVYEAGVVDGTMFIAMRYIPGRDLAQVLRREAPLDADRVIAISAQLADALDAAHARGLIHRDVKPANVLLEDRGEDWAWLADFGLTRRIEGSAPTRADGLAGSIDYMAPEAIQGAAVDGRADQYSLACLIFHCLAGVAPFEGDTEASVLYAHVNQAPPPLPGSSSGAGEARDAALRRALAKDPHDRFPDCRAFVAALRGDPSPAATTVPALVTVAPPGSTDEAAAVSAQEGTATRGRRRHVIGALAAAVAVAGTLLVLGTVRTGDPAVTPEPPVGSLTPSGPGPLTGDQGVIVFAGDDAGNYDIWAALPDGTGLRPLTTGRVRERMPDVSPDGSTVVFAAGPDGKRDLYRINADGSGRTRLTSWQGDDYAPAFSPDGRSIAWTSDHSGNDDIWIMTDEGEGFLEDAARNVTDHPATNNNHEDQYPSWFPDGRRIAFSSNRAESADIWVVDPSAEDRPRARTADGVADLYPTVGPDDEIVFAGRRDKSLDPHLYLMRGPGDAPRRLTNSSAQETTPDFSPGGDELVFAQSGQAAGTRLVTTTAGGERPRVIPIDMPNALDPAWVTRLGSP